MCIRVWYSIVIKKHESKTKDWITLNPWTQWARILGFYREQQLQSLKVAKSPTSESSPNQHLLRLDPCMPLFLCTFPDRHIFFLIFFFIFHTFHDFGAFNGKMTSENPNGFFLLLKTYKKRQMLECQGLKLNSTKLINSLISFHKSYHIRFSICEFTKLPPVFLWLLLVRKWDW